MRYHNAIRNELTTLNKQYPNAIAIFAGAFHASMNIHSDAPNLEHWLPHVIHSAMARGCSRCVKKILLFMPCRPCISRSLHRYVFWGGEIIMPKPVYILIYHIPSFHKPETKVDIFETLPQAQATKARLEKCCSTVFCNIYKSYKVQ